jgi:NAD(P) transhydrogenase subunit alpha
MTIGVLREGEGENRVALLPEHVASLAKKSIEVMVEKDAGTLSFAEDQDYLDAGAKVSSRLEVIKSSDVIFAIHGPADKIPDGKVLVSVFGPLTNNSLVEQLAKS